MIWSVVLLSKANHSVVSCYHLLMNSTDLRYCIKVTFDLIRESGGLGSCHMYNFMEVSFAAFVPWSIKVNLDGRPDSLPALYRNNN